MFSLSQYEQQFCFVLFLHPSVSQMHSALVAAFDLNSFVRNIYICIYKKQQNNPLQNFQTPHFSILLPVHVKRLFKQVALNMLLVVYCAAYSSKRGAAWQTKHRGMEGVVWRSLKDCTHIYCWSFSPVSPCSKCSWAWHGPQANLTALVECVNSLLPSGLQLQMLLICFSFPWTVHRCGSLRFSEPLSSAQEPFSRGLDWYL